eukprot:UN16404
MVDVESVETLRSIKSNESNPAPIGARYSFHSDASVKPKNNNNNLGVAELEPVISNSINHETDLSKPSPLSYVSSFGGSSTYSGRSVSGNTLGDGGKGVNTNTDKNRMSCQKYNRSVPKKESEVRLKKGEHSQRLT